MNLASVFKLIYKTVKEIVKKDVNNVLSSSPESYAPLENKTFKPLRWEKLVMVKNSLKLIYKTDIKPYLVNALEKGINVQLVHSENDLAFPLEELKENLGEELTDDILTVIQGADHNAIIRRPGPFAKYVTNKFIE